MTTDLEDRAFARGIWTSGLAAFLVTLVLYATARAHPTSLFDNGIVYGVGLCGVASLLTAALLWTMNGPTSETDHPCGRPYR